MFEVEKRLKLTPEEIKIITKNSKFLHTQILKNTYYDDSSFSLIRQKVWLRKRNNRYELKIKQFPSKLKVSQCLEIEGVEKIKEYFKIPKNKSFKKYLEKNKFKEICTYTTKRQTYIKKGFTINIDQVNFKTYRRDLVEIEKLVKTVSQIGKAEKEILNFIKKHKIKIKETPGKMSDYLRRENPKVYKVYKVWLESKISNN